MHIWLLWIPKTTTDGRKLKTPLDPVDPADNTVHIDVEVLGSIPDRTNLGIKLF